MQAIVAENLEFHYGENKAVDGISFSVDRGEILGFLGPNGAGKTTTVSILTGQLKSFLGRASLLDLDIRKNTREILAQVGVCFESTNLYEQMSAEENLRFFSRLFGNRSFDAGPLLARVGLGGREKDKVETFSKGLKQRLMIARALVNEPMILFLDEPTDGLDPVSAQAIRRVILEEKERGASVFLTTHDMTEADKLSDRVAFINEGKIVALDTPHNLKQSYGKRALKVETLNSEGALETRELSLDGSDAGRTVQEMIDRQEVVTIHSAEASLEDIFITITGRGLE